MKKIIVIGISLLFFIGVASQASARHIHCWDLNENYACDIETEDMNVDGKCNKHDCESVPPEEPCYAVQQTGQTTSYATGDDGELQTGIAWPDPRFTDNGNGTVTDNLTGLIWTKTTKRPWQMAGSVAGGAIGEAIDKADRVSDSKQNINELDSKPMTHDNVKPCMPCVAEEMTESEEN